MPDSVAAKLGRATRDGLTVALWNAGMDAQSFQSGTEHGFAVQNLVESVLELADTCHVVGISELHPTHASELREMLTRRRPQLDTRSFHSHEAVVWNRTLITHQDSRMVRTRPYGETRHSNKMHVACRFATIEGTEDEAEWILMVTHVKIRETCRASRSNRLRLSRT